MSTGGWEGSMGLGPEPIDDEGEEKKEDNEDGMPPKDERPGVND